MRLKSVLFVLLLTCSVGGHAKNVSPAKPVSKSSALDGELFYQILLGEINAGSDEPDVAFSLMLDAARKTNDPAVFRRAVQIALQARSGQSALQAAKAWSQAIPASAEANRFVLQILLGLNRTAETLEPLKRQLSLVPSKDRQDLIWSIPAYYERASDRFLAATTVQKALSGLLDDPISGATAWAAVGRLWLSAGDTVKALSAAAKGLAVNASAEHPALLALSMLSPDLPEAERLVKKHLPSARPQFRMAYIKALLGTGREEDAKLQLQTMRANSPDYADTWLVAGALALQAGQLALAEQQLQHYIDLAEATPATQQQTQRGRSQAFFSMAHIAQQRKDLEQADHWLQRVDDPDDVLLAQIRRAMLIAQQGKVDEAIGLIQGQAERSETDTRLKRSAKVQILREQKLFARAREMLQNFIDQTPDDLDLLYDLAMVSEKLGDLAEMERLLRSLMLARPEDPQAYNALGYSMADRNMRLPEAIQLITKALQLTPNDPYIADSLAWAEFRSGNQGEALRLLQTAFKQKPDAEIAAHLGEVLWTSGQQESAIEVFRQGIKLNQDNETLTETIQRLRVPL